jgi:Na+/H+ antiporter NhaD/arsenite permease-like protein
LAEPLTDRAIGRTIGPWAGRAALGLVLAVVLGAVLVPWIVPADAAAGRRIAAGTIFSATYVALAIGRVPGLAIDRAGIALVGACLMVGAGALPLEDAYKAIDLDTVTLLLGMMIVVASLRLSGFFVLVNGFVARRMTGPVALLMSVSFVTALFSAFLVNDAICLVMAPLVMELTLALKRRPMPYLLAVAMASNVGSVATLTGNPQNIMIGSFSRIPYPVFAAALTPVALAGLAMMIGLIVLLHRGDLSRMDGARRPRPRQTLRVNRALVGRALVATIAMVGLFFAGQPPAKAAILIGGLLLLTRRLRSVRIYREIDWSLLLMFAGLFIIVAGAQAQLLSPGIVADAGALHLDRPWRLSVLTAALSNLVSNVPAVLVLKPFVDALPDHDQAWKLVAMASTLAGNFTVLGSIANLIVVEKAAARGIAIGFWDYFRIGAPLTILSIAAGTVWLAF